MRVCLVLDRQFVPGVDCGRGDRVEMVKNPRSRTVGLAFTLLLGLVAGSIEEDAHGAVTERGISSRGYTFRDLRPSIEVNTFVQPDEATISAKIYRKRLAEGAAIPEVEPVYVYAPEDRSELKKWLGDIARKNEKKPLIKEFFKRFDRGDFEANRGWLKVAVNGKLSQHMAPRKIAAKLKKRHLNVYLDGKQLAADKRLRRNLLVQAKPFINRKQYRRLKADIRGGKLISVTRQLLPKFARKNIKKFTPYQGPNCFHAALSFHSETYGLSKRFNIKKERNHHNIMINYDELYRILFMDFREIDPRKEELHFGDIIVFFDKDTQASRKRFYFKWIKHTLVYLFNSYTFSKGSKSANTPYTIKTVGGEWRTWRKLTQNLQLKVFRRKPSTILQNSENIATGWVN